MDMNKLCKTCKHAPTFILMALFCKGNGRGCRNVEKSVKQTRISGTFLHMRSGITGFCGGKTPFLTKCFCEGIGNRIVKTAF